MGHWIDVGNKSLNGYERNNLFRNVCSPDRGVRFEEMAFIQGADRIEDGRGAVAADFDRDGDLYVVIQSYSQPVTYLTNLSEPRNWLQVELEGTVSNRDAIGARIEVQAGERTLVRELRTSSGYLSGPSLVTSFGLGSEREIERLTVRWPSGGITRLEGVKANQRLRLREEATGK